MDGDVPGKREAGAVTSIPGRVAFVLHWEDGPLTGPARKVRRQIQAWRSLGCDAQLSVLTTERAAPAWRELGDSTVTNVLVGPIDEPGVATQRKIWGAQKALLADAIATGPALLYHRQTIWYPSLRRHADSVPLVVEVNGDDVSELTVAGPRKAVLNRLTRRWYLERAAGFAAVSNELAGRFADFPGRITVIANGIDLARHPTLPPTTDGRPRLVFVGHPGIPWHGIDRVLALARLTPEWTYEIVGYTAGDLGPLPDNVDAHGELFGDALLAVLRRCDVGIGSLAMHRAGINEASPLKSRTYLAHGLPVIHDYVDTDFPEGRPFLLQLPREDNLSGNTLAVIREFVQNWTGRRVAREDVACLDAVSKERRRVAFFGDVLQDWSERRALSRGPRRAPGLLASAAHRETTGRPQ